MRVKYSSSYLQRIYEFASARWIDWVPLVVLLGFVTLAMTATTITLDKPEIETLPVGNTRARPEDNLMPLLSDSQKEGLKVTMEANKLATSLAVLVFGGVGLLAGSKSGFSIDTIIKKVTLSLILSSCCLSLYAGYVLYDALIEMLASDYLTLTSRSLILPRNIQVYSLLVSIILLGCLFLGCLRPRDSKGNKIT